MNSRHPPPPRTALQLYSVRDAFEANPEATLSRIGALGFEAVEWFGDLRGRSPGQWRDTLRAAGLEMVAAHVPFKTLTSGSDLGPLLDSYLTMGCSHLVCPYLDEAERALGYNVVGRRLDLAAYQLQSAGFRLSYHHHDFEFANNQDGLATILQQASTSNLGAELDVFWLAWANQDIQETIERISGLAGGIPLVHLKDGVLSKGRSFAYPEMPFRALGEGELNLDTIVATSFERGAETMIVEQDFFSENDDPLTVVGRSLRSLEALPAFERWNPPSEVETT